MLETIWFASMVVDSSWFASTLLLLMAFVQMRGCLAFYQDLTRTRLEAPPPAGVPEPAKAPTPAHPETIWLAKTGKVYHIYPDCQYVKKAAQAEQFHLCTSCQKKTKQRARQ